MANTVHLDITNTQLRTLPLFSGNEWPHLRIVDLQSNIHLNICSRLEEIFDIQDLTLLIDCLPQTSAGIHTRDPEHTAIYTIVIMIMVLLESGAVIAFFLQKRGLKNYHQQQDQPQQTSLLDITIRECPYCSQCVDEVGGVVMDYSYNKFPFCVHHNPETTV